MQPPPALEPPAYDETHITVSLKLAMGRNLYILAGTVGLLGLLSLGLSFTHLTQQPGAPNDQLLWRTTGVVLICVASVAALGGILSTLFEQAERRHTAEREAVRRNRRQS